MRINTDYVHALDGRLRIKVPEVKNTPSKARQVETQLNCLGGVTRVNANPITGNVLILYNPEYVQQSDIIKVLWDLDCLQGQSTPGDQPRSMSKAGSEGLMERVAGSMAQSILEIALTRFVTALI